jgi:hypothetical protein
MVIVQHVFQESINQDAVVVHSMAFNGPLNHCCRYAKKNNVFHSQCNSVVYCGGHGINGHVRNLNWR